MMLAPLAEIMARRDPRTPVPKDWPLLLARLARAHALLVRMDAATAEGWLAEGERLPKPAPKPGRHGAVAWRAQDVCRFLGRNGVWFRLHVADLIRSQGFPTPLSDAGGLWDAEAVRAWAAEHGAAVTAIAARRARRTPGEPTREAGNNRPAAVRERQGDRS